MMTLDKNSKDPVSKGKRAIFALLALGFTLISTWNGFNFYRVIFGLSMAVLISSVFEITRFACLFRFMNTGKNVGFLSIVLYIIVASVCAFASINSFTQEIIHRNRIRESEQRNQIHIIKKAYLEREKERFNTLDRDIRYLENKVAKYPDRDYWKRRLSQIKTNRDAFVKERDSFININPENPEQWISEKSALLGLKLEKPSGESEEMTSVIQALRELWGFEKITAQKIMGIVVTLTVELSILLLAFLASVKVRSWSVTKKITNRKELLKILHNNFEEKHVKKFLSLSRDHLSRKGKLPPMRKLSMNLRPIRIFLQDSDNEKLKELFRK